MVISLNDSLVQSFMKYQPFLKLPVEINFCMRHLQLTHPFYSIDARHK